jgi:glucose/mannose-6-phosphate isomerase
MEQLISGFSTQLEHAFEIFNQYPFKQKNEDISQVVFCGMGGSGIGGRIVAQWVEQEIQVPITFIQNYEIPNWINTSTLVIASSYSGNTEETLEAVRCCQNRGARIICISSGGGITRFLQSVQFRLHTYSERTSSSRRIRFFISSATWILVYHGLIEKKVFQQLHGCIEFLKIHQSAIKQIAHEAVPVINHTNVVIYSEASYESVAIRGKQQMNENSKFLCRHNTIPEMNHNELLGDTIPKSV